MSKNKRLLTEKQGEGKGISQAIKVLEAAKNKEAALNDLCKMLAANVEECRWYEIAVKADIKAQNDKARGKRS